MPHTMSLRHKKAPKTRLGRTSSQAEAGLSTLLRRQPSTSPCFGQSLNQTAKQRSLSVFMARRKCPNKAESFTFQSFCHHTSFLPQPRERNCQLHTPGQWAASSGQISKTGCCLPSLAVRLNRRSAGTYPAFCCAVRERTRSCGQPSIRQIDA